MNTGTVPGREVVELYVSPPAGRLDQPWQKLAGFGKTGTLQPGEVCRIFISFDLEMQSTYDAKRAVYLLEAGDYLLRLGDSSRNTVVCGVVTLEEEVVTRRVKNCLDAPDFTDFVPERPAEEEIPSGVERLRMSAADFETEVIDYDQPSVIAPEVKALSEDELLHLAMGHFNPKGGITSVVGNAGSLVAGSAGETAHVDGIKTLIMADGPAGLRISQRYFTDRKGVHSMAAPMPESMLAFAPGPLKLLLSLMTPKPKHRDQIRYQYCTAVPIGTAVAQSWNTEFAALCGDIVGTEMERYQVDLWLAPALNIQRSIRCGRNFEYYSEDPLVSGIMAASVTAGVQKHPGKGVTVKHFAANNQEYHRTSSNSLVSERAMREIYLKGFEICVKCASPAAVMSSYNLINGKHASLRKDLLCDILRSEFGFRGIVMTDWLIRGGMIPENAKYPSPEPAEIAAAGGDLYMPGSREDFEKLVQGYRAGVVTREQLEINTTRILQVL